MSRRADPDRDTGLDMNRCSLGAVVLASILLALSPAEARADRPTSGDMSLLSGRTLGVDNTVIAAGLGWPGFWAQVELAPSSTFNLGIRGEVDYGSPIMGVGTAIGGGVSVPMRIHFYGEGSLDLAVGIRPLGVVGEGSTVGARDVFSDDLGWGVGSEARLLLGYQASDDVTIGAGAGGGLYYVNVPDDDTHSDLVGSMLVSAVIEALMRRDTMLFAEIVAGYGFAPGPLFDGNGVVRVSLGVAYLL
ncbi:MAG: hypothetical protein ACOCUS_06890 [Polyangiales bacterium]